MKKLSPDALLFCSVLSLCSLLDWAQAQDAAGDTDALQQGLTWQHNGQIFSLLSRGSQYRPSRRHAGSSRRINPVVIVSGANDTVPAGPRLSPRAPAGPRLSPRVPAASSAAQLRATTHGHQQPPAGRREEDGAPVRREDMMVGDDPYNPYKASNYYPYYNYYNSYYRPRPRAYLQHGYGTRYHQNGTKKTVFAPSDLELFYSKF